MTLNLVTTIIMSIEIKDQDIPNCLRVQKRISDYELFIHQWNQLCPNRQQALQPYYDVYMQAHIHYLVWLNDRKSVNPMTKAEILQSFVEIINEINIDVDLKEAKMLEILIGCYGASQLLGKHVEVMVFPNHFARQVVVDQGLLTCRINGRVADDPVIIQQIKNNDPMERESIYLDLCDNYLDAKQRYDDKKIVEIQRDQLDIMLQEHRNATNYAEQLFYGPKYYQKMYDDLSEERKKEITEYLLFYKEVFTVYDEWKANSANQTVDCCEILEQFVEESRSITSLTQYELCMFGYLNRNDNNPLVINHWHPLVGYPKIQDLMNENYQFLDRVIMNIVEYEECDEEYNEEYDEEYNSNSNFRTEDTYESQ